MAAPAAQLSANQVYYDEIGVGRWTGRFGFSITSWRTFWRAPLGLKNRLLILSIGAVQKLPGTSTIASTITLGEREGTLGIANNVIRITRYGMTLYLVTEVYTLEQDGHGVSVYASERFGPIPFLFRVEKTYRAEIHDPGTSSTYWMPLLGTDWVASYHVHDDRRHVDGRVVCDWGFATETIEKVAP
jgi:hypothetical protein